MSQVKEVFRVIREFIRILPVQVFFKPPKDDEKKSLGSVFQTTAERYPERTAIIFEGRELSWRELNALVNRFAHLLKQQGVERGDTVALLMQNRIEMLAALLAGCKLGVITGLINNSLTGKSLLHCIRSVDSKKCIVGEEVFPHIAEIRAELELEDKDLLWVRDIAQNDGQGQAPEWAFDASAVLADMPDNNPPETTEILAGEKAFYIFTSGTTGLPKAAVLYHRRYLSASEPYAKVGFSAKPTDRLYACLPLYHITGLGVGVGSCLVSGASVYLRRNFSASAFWPEVQKYQCNLFIYVGELCRYLAMQPECPEEKNNPIEKMMGNGLRPDIWDQFRHRFDVGRICEMYGSSEGNASFLNVLNKDHTIGVSTANLMLVQYDVDNDEMVRDEQGKLVEVKKGEPGLLLAKIEGRYQYDGYQDKQATNSKVLTDLQETGDRWFNTGDMVKQIDVGFAMGLPHFQFVDRVGDTFRWRAENVSTNEVGEILCCHDQVAVANVYGVEVPGAEGRAGMVAITPNDPEQFDMAGFAAYIEAQLPHYARPVFIRLQKEAETTVTFKLFKGRLRKEAYHLDQIDDPVYVLKPSANSYELLDADFYQELKAGTAGY